MSMYHIKMWYDFLHNVATIHFQSAHMEGLAFPLVRLVQIQCPLRKGLLEEDLQIQDSNPKTTAIVCCCCSHIMYTPFMFLERNVTDVTSNGIQHNFCLPHLGQCVCVVWDCTYDNLHSDRDGAVEGWVASIFGHDS